MLRLSRDLYMEMVAHCLAGLPDEACGLLVGPYGGDEVVALFPTPNAAASAMVYEIDPKDLLRVDRAARALGADIMGVFHSHTHTDAYPSPTDVAQATDPGWHYVLVSLPRHPPRGAQLRDRGRPDHRGAGRRARPRRARPRGASTGPGPDLGSPGAGAL